VDLCDQKKIADLYSLHGTILAGMVARLLAGKTGSIFFYYAYF
jgi:hypothetical protein